MRLRARFRATVLFRREVCSSVARPAVIAPPRGPAEGNLRFAEGRILFHEASHGSPLLAQGIQSAKASFRQVERVGHGAELGTLRPRCQCPCIGFGHATCCSIQCACKRLVVCVRDAERRLHAPRRGVSCCGGAGRLKRFPTWPSTAWSLPELARGSRQARRADAIPRQRPLACLNSPVSRVASRKNLT